MTLDHSRCYTTQIAGWLCSIAQVVVSAAAIDAVAAFVANDAVAAVAAVGGVPVTVSVTVVVEAIGVAIDVDGAVLLRWRSNLFIF